MEATIYFEKDSEVIPELSKTIQFKDYFTAQRNLKLALRWHLANLHKFYGYGVEVKYKCLMKGSDAEIMNGSIQL